MAERVKESDATEQVRQASGDAISTVKEAIAAQHG
jgi:hypothetical protein